MKQYLDLMRHVHEFGDYKEDRTGTGTYSVFGYQMRFDLSDGFPLVTTKRCHLKSIVHELLWFLKGETNVRYLKENGVSIWDEWVDPDTAVYEVMSIQERLNSIPADSGKNEMVGGFFDKYLGNPELWAEEYTIRRSTKGERKKVLINKDGYDFLPDFLDKIGVDDKKLVAGELGPVYGKQWRSWPNPQKPKQMEILQRIELWNKHAVSNFPYSGETLTKMVDIIDDTATNFKPWTFHEFSKRAAEVWGFKDGVAKLFDLFGVPTHCIDEEGSIDQISNLVEALKNGPDSRRLLVSAWNPAQVDIMALPPCHCLFQFYSANMTYMKRWDYARKMGLDVDHLRGGSQEIVHAGLDELGVPRRKLSCQLYQRSADIFLGVPFNIASYALLTMMVARVTGHADGEFIWTGGDCHLYSNHIDQVNLQLSRTPHALPTMKINPEVKDLFAFRFEDFELVGYECDPAISAPVAV